MNDKSQNKLRVSSIDGKFFGKLFVKGDLVKDVVHSQQLIVRQEADEYFGVNRYIVEYEE